MGNKRSVEQVLNDGMFNNPKKYVSTDATDGLSFAGIFVLAEAAVTFDTEPNDPGGKADTSFTDTLSAGYHPLSGKNMSVTTADVNVYVNLKS